MLVTHFDLPPSGQEAWITDKDGGINHCDFREGKGQRSRRRWIVQEEGRAAKLGGMSINRESSCILSMRLKLMDGSALMPYLLVTAGNDQNLRIWDTRHLLCINPKAAEILTPPNSANDESATASHTDTNPTSTVGYDKVSHHMTSAKGKGLLRASLQHGKSCSAAYWDPWGRRVLTTSYDDKLRSEHR